MAARHESMTCLQPPPSLEEAILDRGCKMVEAQIGAGPHSESWLLSRAPGGTVLTVHNKLNGRAMAPLLSLYRKLSYCLCKMVNNRSDNVLIEDKGM